jgi:uncharacterized protein (TIGR02328 family)
MRLWHIDLITTHSLPKLQLLAQWRELNSIYKKQDNHILINFIYQYPKEDLLLYSFAVIKEMRKRGIKIKTWHNFKSYFNGIINVRNISQNRIPFKYKMNKNYLMQCLCNLEEKAECGGIPKNEWEQIINVYKGDYYVKYKLLYRISIRN